MQNFSHCLWNGKIPSKISPKYSKFMPWKASAEARFGRSEYFGRSREKASAEAEASFVHYIVLLADVCFVEVDFWTKV